jgi:hypothetical protein
MRPAIWNRLAAAGCGLCLLLSSGCGGASEAAQARASGCVIADVSGSTSTARAAYTAGFTKFAQHIGASGSGRLCVVLAAGDPQAEDHPVSLYVGPGDSSTLAEGQSQSTRLRVALAVAKARHLFEQVLAEPAIGQNGSALLEAALVAAPHLQPGDELLYLSDGIQSSSTTGDFHTTNLSAAGTTQLLDRLGRENLLAHLRGVHVVFPFLLYHPGGLRMSHSQEAAIRAFWEAWASRCEATISFPIPPD